MTIFSISAKANRNYLCKLFQLKQEQISKHPNADNLQIVDVDFTPVISNNPVVGNWYVYFPTESQIDEAILTHGNLYRDAQLNRDQTQTGFFEKNGRVKTIKLRGEYSSGVILPLSLFKEFFKDSLTEEECYFDTVTVKDTEKVIIKKYYKKFPVDSTSNSSGSDKTERKVKSLGLQEHSFQFHESTENFRRNWQNVKPESIITVSSKLHGSSAIISLLPAKKEKPKKWYHKLFRLTPKTEDTFVNVWSSRKVIKNLTEGSGFYTEDIWGRVNEDFKDKIPKGSTIYGELIGYQKNGEYIQKDYDYGLEKTQYQFMPYRITSLDLEGNHIELSSSQVKEFAKKAGMRPLNIIFSGKMEDHYTLLCVQSGNKQYLEDLNLYFEERSKTTDYYSPEAKEALVIVQQNYVKLLEEFYTEKDCEFCNNSVPEEGVIIRLENSIHKFEAYKLKSFRFLGMESKLNDQGVENLEDQESNV